MPEQRVFIVRHGERCDFTFARSGLWTNSFDSNGKYRPLDINLPRTLPKRPDGIQGFTGDSPLTEIGYLQSKLTGRALRDNNIQINHVVCSPALRCVQTTIGLLKGMALDKHLQFTVEPGLYEWMTWARYGKPNWIPPKDLRKLGYPVNENYVPCWTHKELKMDEDLPDYYQRSFGCMNKILADYPEGNILIVAHGASLEACTRQLVGGNIRSVEDFYYLLNNTPYLSCVELSSREGLWKIDGRPIPSFTHAVNSTFDPVQLVTKDLESFRRERGTIPGVRAT